MLPLTVDRLRVRSPQGRDLIFVDALTVPAGGTLAIRGPSGAGKSTLLYALAGLVPVASGRVVWGTTDIAGLPDAARARFRGNTFGIVFQDHMLFEELSAIDNARVAAFYSPRARRQSITDTAQRALSDLGLSTDAARTVSSYSGGERQRIALARALASQPPVMLADEPTASLDRATADRLIADLFAQLRRDGRGLIIVSHDPHVLDAADQVVTISDGRVVADV